MACELEPITETTKHRLAKRLRDAELSVRTFNALTRNDIVFVGDLVQHSEAQLLGFWGLGKNSLQEVKRYLAPDLHLGMNISGWSHEVADAIERGIATDDSGFTNVCLKVAKHLSPAPEQSHIDSLPDSIKARLAM